MADGLNFTPQTVSYSQFQNRAILKSPGFETGATERALKSFGLAVVSSDGVADSAAGILFAGAVSTCVMSSAIPQQEPVNQIYD